MSELLELFEHRRSVRRYTGEPVPREKLDLILAAGLSGASGHGWYPADMIVVEDRETLHKLAGCRAGSAKMLEGAALAIVVVGDAQKSDTWVEDTSIMLTNMQLMADALGLGSCWIQGRGRKASDERDTETFVRELVPFPENYRLEAILSLGVPDGHPGPRRRDPASDPRVHWAKF